MNELYPLWSPNLLMGCLVSVSVSGLSYPTLNPLRSYCAQLSIQLWLFTWGSAPVSPGSMCFLPSASLPSPCCHPFPRLCISPDHPHPPLPFTVCSLGLFLSPYSLFIYLAVLGGSRKEKRLLQETPGVRHRQKRSRLGKGKKSIQRGMDGADQAQGHRGHQIRKT